MFTIEVLPAQRGDCLWITYGHGSDLHHVVVDAGPQETIPTLVPELERRITALPGRTNRVELLVVSHVDADHIQGVVSLLSDHRRVPLFRDVWFNGWKHLAEGLLGAPDGERLTSALESSPGRWNKAFKGGPVVVADSGALPVRRLRGGLEVTLLAPDHEALRRLVPEWETACARAGILPGQGAEIVKPSWRRDELLGLDWDLLGQAPYRRDSSKPNGASIAMIVAFEGKRVLLLADAPAEAVVAGLDRLGPGPHRFDAVKLSHHGSRRNTSPALLERIRSRTWLVSTDGAQFKHPDAECLARVITTQPRPTFALNYVTEFVTDLIDGAGERYGVRLPRKRRDGSYEEGFTLRLD